MGPTTFPAPRPPALKVVCRKAKGSNASRHLDAGEEYEVLAIVDQYTTAKGAYTKKGYVLRGVDYIWDADRFEAVA